MAARPLPLLVSSVGTLLLSPMVVAPRLPVSQKDSPPAAHGHHIVPLLAGSDDQSSKPPLVSGVAGAVVKLSWAPGVPSMTMRYS